MKIINRYILGQFVKNYLIFLTVIIALYIVMDMVFQFDKIAVVDKGVGAPTGAAAVVAIVRDVCDYYFYQCFLIFTQMSGIIPVVAAAFTLLRLSRFNEVTAMLSAGRHILWMAVPIIAAAVVLNGLLVVDQEYVLPRMIPKLTRKHDDMHRLAGKSYAIDPMPVDGHAAADEQSELLASVYDPGLLTMQDLDVIWRTGNGQPDHHLWADAAAWDGTRSVWKLTGGRMTTGLRPGQKLVADQPVGEYSGVTPDEIALYHDRGSNLVELLSLRRLNELIARPKSYGVAGLYRIKYLRLAQPWMNMVLLALTVPTVLTYDPKALKPAATRCLTLTGLAMGTVFLCQQMAGKPPLGNEWVSLWPALMSWVPIFIWLPVSIVMMERVRT
jgi:lipopolysaccharide export LptBFGC system permease protein LptF